MRIEYISGISKKIRNPGARNPILKKQKAIKHEIKDKKFEQQVKFLRKACLLAEESEYTKLLLKLTDGYAHGSFAYKYKFLEEFLKLEETANHVKQKQNNIFKFMKRIGFIQDY
jgi:hypothetical protein